MPVYKRGCGYKFRPWGKGKRNYTFPKIYVDKDYFGCSIHGYKQPPRIVYNRLDYPDKDDGYCLKKEQELTGSLAL